MAKITRRFQLQPLVEGLDRRIAPSSMVSSSGSPPTDTSPTPTTPTAPTTPTGSDGSDGSTSIKVYGSSSGGSSPTKG